MTAFFYSLDDSTYDTVFQTTAGDALILRVHLPSSITNAAPQMTLVGVRATHNWLDSRMRVTGYSHIQSDTNWQSSGILLGAAVHQVVEHFQLQPPHLIEITDAGLRRLQSSLVGNNSQVSNRTAQHSGATGSTDAPPDYESLFSVPDMPEIPTNFDECFHGMTKEDMQQLLDNELDFLAFACTLPEYKRLQQLGSSVLDENIETAESNLMEEARLKELHSNVTSLQSSLQSKMTAFEVLEKQQNKLCTPPDKRDTIKRLQKAKKQAMDESELCAEEWVDEGGDVKDFIHGFMEKRQLHHTRAAKIERLQVQK
jgi:ESCRT-I complex subunit VPS37